MFQEERASDFVAVTSKSTGSPGKRSDLWSVRFRGDLATSIWK